MKHLLKCIKLNCVVRCYVKQASDMKYLNVAEKHDAAKTIAGLLSNGTARRREGYSVYNKIFDFETTVRGTNSKMVMTSVSGHLLQLEFLNSYRSWLYVDPKTLFDAPVRKNCPEDYKPIKRTLEREIRSCQGLIVWTDCDREGENIGFEIIDVCRAIKPNIQVYRAIFSEITMTAVRRALQQLKIPDKRQSDAVDVRTELDLRTGAAITRFLTLRLQRLFPKKIADKLISYGSCQIPTLGFVAERYKEIEAFVSEPFWKIRVLHTIDDLTVEFLWARNRLFDKQACEDYLLICLTDPKATVESVNVKPKHKWRPVPMDTVEMEKLGSRKLKLSAKETMAIAEKLYTKGIISYPRTETNQFSKDFNLSSLVEQQTAHTEWGTFAQRVLEWGPNPRNGNKSDQAHPPIHPTKLVTNLQGNEARVYELVVRHFLACISKDAVGTETIVHIDIAGEKFHANGLCILERNYLDVYIYDKWNAKQIHKYDQGQVFGPTEISMQEGATTAPPLLTEADLIALMEKHGIGTDATHAEHINTIKERGYIGVVDKGFLVPGVIGMGLYEGYDAMELALAKPLLRAEFEADLKRICLGEKDPKLVLTEQIRKYKESYQQIMNKINAMDAKIAQRLNETPSTQQNNCGNDGTVAEASDNENNANRMQELYKCPKCAVAPLALRQKKKQSGYFIGCLNYPDCKNSVWLPDECKEPSILDETCPKCGTSYKMLKFKFTTAYYRTMFNAPFGWYKTCLRCDAQFRNSFNINLDSVKSVGGIVGETTATTTCTPLISADSMTGSRRNTAGNVIDSAHNTADNRTESIRNTVGNTSCNTPSTESKRPKPATTAKRKKTTENNIRNYFTSTKTSVDNTTLQQLNNEPIDDFFNSNDDDFDEVLMTIDENVNSNATNAAAKITAAGFTDDVAAAFAADNDGDNEFAGIVLSSGPPYSPPFPPTVSMSRPYTTNTYNNFDDSFSNFFRENDDDLDNYVWGTKAARAAERTVEPPQAKKMRTSSSMNQIYRHEDDDDPDSYALAPKCSGCHQIAKSLTVRRDGPNKGRPFYVCPKENACKFFEWADQSDTQTQNSTTNRGPIGWGSGDTNSNKNVAKQYMATEIKCNCGRTANSLTVRKEGGNKGRPFFACATSSCKFFKWGDEDVNKQASTSSGTSNDNWGTGHWKTIDQNSNANLQNSNSSKTRKCGLCRQEGHTRNKCPRKNEFEY